MKSIISISLLLFAFAHSKAQQQDSVLAESNLRRTNAVYLELAGNTLGLSANYERKIYSNNFYSLHSRIGIGLDITKPAQNNLFVPSLPLEFSGSFGSSKHHLEIGIGITPFYSKNGAWRPESNYDTSHSSYKLNYLIVGRIGYRLETKKGWIWRIAYCPSLYNSPYRHEYDYETVYGIAVGKFF